MTQANVLAQFGSPESAFFRNRIINGDMRIDQRNAGASVSIAASGTPYTVDRFRIGNITDGAVTAQQDSSAPAGFVNSLKITVTTQDSSLSSTQSFNFLHSIEGTNVSDLAWGTANAKTVTLSFWVRSSLTGTFGGSLRNSAQNRSYPFTYSISVADTWEYKTVTIVGDTSGTWLTNTEIGIQVNLCLGAGTDRSGTAGAWNSNNNTSATGAVSVIGTLNATWYITGVQLEVGSTATPFERRPFGTELALCQRYYWKLQSTGTNNIGPGMGWTSTVFLGTLSFPVTMRTAPTGSVSSSTAFTFIAAGNAYQSSAVTSVAAGATDQTAGFDITRGSGGLTAGHAGQIRFTSASDWLAYSAEL